MVSSFREFPTIKQKLIMKPNIPMVVYSLKKKVPDFQLGELKKNQRCLLLTNSMGMRLDHLPQELLYMVLLSSRKGSRGNFDLLKWPWNPNKNFIA